MSAKWFWKITVLIFFSSTVTANVQSKVRCSKDLMEVDIARISPQAKIYLQQLKNYPDEACRPVFNNGVATFKLSLVEQNMSRCGMARVVNKMTGQKVYYHRIIVEEPVDSSKHTFTVKCIVTEVTVQPMISRFNHTLERRSILPADFKEDDTIDIRGEIAGSAPIPMLSVVVRQGGNPVTGELNVSPGTPLEMEIFLDRESAPVYGLLVTYMQVTDTKSAEETIIFNGCSVDPYVFENFNTVNGDYLTAKFRAFKFPESTFVQFNGTVNVCLDKCQGVECSNGQMGFGRKKRAIPSSRNKNEVFEVTMFTLIRVDSNSDTVPEEELSQFIRPGKKRTIGDSITGEEVQEKIMYRFTEIDSNAGEKHSWGIFSILMCYFLRMLL